MAIKKRFAVIPGGQYGADSLTRRAQDGYGFTPAVEKEIVRRICTDPKFFGSVAHELDHKALTSIPAQRLVEAAKTAKARSSTGQPPTDMRIVVEVLNDQCRVSKMTFEDELTCRLYADSALNAEPMASQELLDAITPELRRRLAVKVAAEAADVYGKQKDTKVLKDLIHRMDNVGKIDTDLGAQNLEDVLGEFERERVAERIFLGISEVDGSLGGLLSGTTTAIVAGPGGGKSMHLTNAAVHNAIAGRHVACATFELQPHRQYARYVACAINRTIGEVEDDPARASAEFKRKFPAAGHYVVKHFDPGKHGIQDVECWIDDLRQDRGIDVRIVQIDYFNLLGKRFGIRQDKLQQLEAASVYFLHWMQRIGGWGLTGAAPTRGASRPRKLNTDGSPRDQGGLDIGDEGECHAITKDFDTVVYTTVYEDDRGGSRQIRAKIGKNRSGDSRALCDPYYPDFRCARITRTPSREIGLEE